MPSLPCWKDEGPSAPWLPPSSWLASALRARLGTASAEMREGLGVVGTDVAPFWAMHWAQTRLWPASPSSVLTEQRGARAPLQRRPASRDSPASTALAWLALLAALTSTSRGLQRPEEASR